MPRQLQKIEILEKQDKHTIIESTIFLRNLITKQFSQRLKIHVESENKILLEILDGIAKGTQSTISIILDDEKTVCNINTNVKLSLKAAILYPIIKKEYAGFLTKISKKIMGNINE
jgi:preprotein translocase subunit Sec63